MAAEVETPPQYLAVKNWSKFQPLNKNGKRSREWIRMDCNLEDDTEFTSLSVGARWMFFAVIRFAGRCGKWPRSTDDALRRLGGYGHDTGMILRGWRDDLIRIGKLILCNQQEIDYILPISSTGRNVTIRNETKEEPPIVPRRGTRKSPLPYSKEFEEFWSVYPRKVAKIKAWESYQRLNPQNGLHQKILRSVAEHEKTGQWQKDGGEFIPHPTTFLNQKLFDDELASGKLPLVDDRSYIRGVDSTNLGALDSWKLSKEKFGGKQ